MFTVVRLIDLHFATTEYSCGKVFSKPGLAFINLAWIIIMSVWRALPQQELSLPLFSGCKFVQPLYAGSEDVLGVRGSFCDVCSSLWVPEGAHLNYEN